MNYECGCERGGDCTKTSMCFVQNVLEDQREELQNQIRDAIDDTFDGFAPDPVPHDLCVFIKAIQAIIK